MSNALKAPRAASRSLGRRAVVERADAIILPGVGASATGCRRCSRGLVDVLRQRVMDEGVPFLGVCLGMQFLASRSFEHGEHAGLGWIDGSVNRITPADPALKVPHMGWNDLDVTRAESPLLRGIESGTAVYFVHSYHFVPAPDNLDCVVATTGYGGDLVAAVQRDHIFGVQFHPEKSQGAGLAILKNFADHVTGHAQETTDTLAARS